MSNELYEYIVTTDWTVTARPLYDDTLPGLKCTLEPGMHVHAQQMVGYPAMVTFQFRWPQAGDSFDTMWCTVALAELKANAKLVAPPRGLA